MLRPTPTRLELRGLEIDALILGITPHDPRRIPAGDFEPALRQVAALGHLVRRYIHPGAWVREASLAFDWRTLVVQGLVASVDRVERAVGLNLDHVAGPGGPLVFRYRHLDADGATDYDPGQLRWMSGREVGRLEAADAAAERVLESHTSAIERGAAEFLAGWLPPHLYVDPDWTVSTLDLAFDVDRPHQDRPAPVEQPPGPGILARLTGPRPTGTRMDRPSLVRWVDARIAEGWLALRDFGADGVVWPFLVVGPRGRAIGLRRAGDGRDWIVSPPLRLSPRACRYAALAVGHHVPYGEDLP